MFRIGLDIPSYPLVFRLVTDDMVMKSGLSSERDVVLACVGGYRSFECIDDISQGRSLIIIMFDYYSFIWISIIRTPHEGVPTMVGL